MTPTLAAILRAIVRAKRNLVIAAGTNIGKTQTLRALAGVIGPEERLVTIEDAFELDLGADPVRHPNVAALQAREPNIEGHGAIDMAELVRWALRMNPDRVIVGEARGAEVVPLLNAMSQGNDGSLTTIHASSSQAGVHPAGHVRGPGTGTAQLRRQRHADRRRRALRRAPGLVHRRAAGRVLAAGGDRIAGRRRRLQRGLRARPGPAGPARHTDPGRHPRPAPRRRPRPDSCSNPRAGDPAMTLIAMLLGAGVAAGILLIAARPDDPPTDRRSRPGGGSHGPTPIRVAGALAAAAAAGLLTRWPVGAVLAGAATWLLPRVLGADRHHQQAMARTDAVASWAEMLRDNLAAAAGLEQAILAAADVAPQPIAAEVRDPGRRRPIRDAAARGADPRSGPR